MFMYRYISLFDGRKTIPGHLVDNERNYFDYYCNNLNK